MTGGRVSDKLDWIEAAALENMKAHHASADAIAKDAATTLTIFLAAMAGGLTYAAKGIDQNSWTWLPVGATAFTIWFFVLSALLVWKCLMMRPIPSGYNEPSNLNQPGFELDELKEAELGLLQDRINGAATRNAAVARWLNALRLSAVASPLVFTASALVWARWA